MNEKSKKEKIWRIGFAVFTFCFLVNLVISAMNMVLFYPVPHFGFLMLLAALICLIAMLFRSGSHIAGAFLLAGTFLISMTFLIFIGKREPEEMTCTLPGSGHTCIVRKENVQMGPGIDKLTADEILIPYVLARHNDAAIAATGAPVTELVTFESDGDGNLNILCDGRCVWQYNAEQQRWKKY